MFGLGPPELIIIFIVVLLIFGPKRIPEAGKAIGEGIRELRSATKEISEDYDKDFKNDEKKE